MLGQKVPLINKQLAYTNNSSTNNLHEKKIYFKMLICQQLIYQRYYF